MALWPGAAPLRHMLRTEPRAPQGRRRSGRRLESLPLNGCTLARHAARVAVPSYDRATLRRGVVHIGVGSFHRSHQAVYFDELAERGLGDGWGLTGVGMHRRAMKEALEAQDGLYTVVSRASDGHDQARVVGIMNRYLFVPEQTQAVLDELTDESTRLVTLTITADGYRVGASDPAARGERTDDPNALALLVEALDRRRRRGTAPFTVLSCDNTPGNGSLARRSVLSLAAQHDPKLAEWIAQRGAFPNSVVDRITPGPSEEQRRLVESEFGVSDRCPVITEPFAQWIVEDAFCNRRPPLDEVGAQFVSDVRPYALMKTRLLNASHCAIGYLGSLAGHRRTDEAINDPLLGEYIERLMDEEIAPLLPPADMNPLAYATTVRARFANQAIADPLSRLCRNGSTKVPVHLLSSIREARATRRPHRLLTLAVSAWCHYLEGRHETAPHLEDPDGERLRALARAGRGDPLPLLRDNRTFGSLGECRDFVATVRQDLQGFRTMGSSAVIAARLADSSTQSVAVLSGVRPSVERLSARGSNHSGPGVRSSRSDGARAA